MAAGALACGGQKASLSGLTSWSPRLFTRAGAACRGRVQGPLCGQSSIGKGIDDTQRPHKTTPVDMDGPRATPARRPGSPVASPFRRVSPRTGPSTADKLRVKEDYVGRLLVDIGFMVSKTEAAKIAKNAVADCNSIDKEHLLDLAREQALCSTLLGWGVKDVSLKRVPLLRFCAHDWTLLRLSYPTARLPCPTLPCPTDCPVSDIVSQSLSLSVCSQSHTALTSASRAPTPFRFHRFSASLDLSATNEQRHKRTVHNKFCL